MQPAELDQKFAWLPEAAGSGGSSKKTDMEIAALEKDPKATVSIDLATAEITLPGGERAQFPIDPFAQKMLLAGKDELGYLLGLSDKIDAFEKTHG